MNRKKITLITIFYAPETGAAASRMGQMARGLAANDYDVRVITALPNYPTGKIFPGYRWRIWKSEVLDEVPILRFCLYPSNSAAAIKRILNMVSFAMILFLAVPHLIRTRPHTIIVNSPPLPVGIIGVVLSKIIRARLVTNVSDIWPKSAVELGAMSEGRFYAFLEKAETFMYRNSDAVVTQSNETQNHVIRRCDDKKTFHYRNLDPISPLIDRYPPIDRRPITIVYAGLLGVAQGVLEICQHINFKSIGAQFHIYGDGIERDLIDQHIRENSDFSIYLHDAVPKAAMPEILSEFHATIIPLKTNISGAFPSKIYAAISASLPILFCGSGEGATIVREKGLGWVSAPADFENLEKNIIRLAALTKNEYESLRKNLSALARNEYDVIDQHQRFASFLETI